MATRDRGFRYAPLAPAAFLLLVSGCAHPAARQLEGRWFGETVENFEEDDIAVATGWARGTSFEFSGSSVTVTIPAEEPRTGRYDVASVHDRDVVLHVAPEEPANGAGNEVALTLLEGGGVRWHLDDQRSILLRRE
jgi:hypothetical protein